MRNRDGCRRLSNAGCCCWSAADPRIHTISLADWQAGWAEILHQNCALITFLFLSRSAEGRRATTQGGKERAEISAPVSLSVSQLLMQFEGAERGRTVSA